MKAILAKAIRQILFVAGGAIGAKSTASDSDVEAITGAVMVIGSLAWSWWTEYTKRRAAARLAATVGLLALLGITGCQTAPTQPQLDNLQDVARNLVKTGVGGALLAKPELRPRFEASLKAVAAAVDSGHVTATQLATLVQDLPVKPETILIVNGLCLFYDGATFLWQNPYTASAILAAARGVEEGLGEALNPKKKERFAQAIAGSPSHPIAVSPPAPTRANTRRL